MSGEPPVPAIDRLGALGHPARFKAVRLLVGAGEDGLAAGALADAVGLKPNALTPHLTRLVAAGLVDRRRAGRTIFYRADILALTGLLGFLLQDCCGGRPELCAPAFDQMELERS